MSAPSLPVRRIGVLSDTHGQTPTTQAAARLLAAFEVELVIHCGDIGTPEVVRALAAWPTHYVWGNCDDGRAELRQAMSALGHVCHEAFGELELAGRRIAFLHGDDGRRLEATIRAGTWDLVCHGHTHVARHEQLGPTWVLNPGALYRARTHTLAVVELPALTVESLTV